MAWTSSLPTASGFKIGLAILSAIGLTGCGAQTDSKTGGPVGPVQKPNVIYILADDLGYADVSANGQKRFETLNIDRLAESGMLFTQHYSGAAVCVPSRSTLLTGQHTGMTQIRHNGGGRKPGKFLQKGPQTLITMLGDAGIPPAPSVSGVWVIMIISALMSTGRGPRIRASPWRMFTANLSAMITRRI